MGFFDFLKVTVRDPKKPAAGGASKTNPVGFIEVDSKSFPLVALTASGFVANRFDGSLITGQNARVVVKVDNALGRFSFPTTISVVGVQDDKLVGEFQLLTPEQEQTLRKFNQLRKQKPGGR